MPTGPDLFAWGTPVAIAPGDGDDGIWTGSLVTDEMATPHPLHLASRSRTSASAGSGSPRRSMTAGTSWTKGDVVVDRPRTST